MDAAMLTPPRRLMIPIDNRWGAGTMSVLDFGDPKRPVDLVFVHANGFNAATYRSLLSPLSASLRILAPDLRGHGRSRLAPTTRSRRGWSDHRDDLLALIDSLEGPPMALAGHSMGGTSALLAGAERRDRVSSLVLFDPVILSRAMTLAMRLPGLRQGARRMPLVRNALRRRATFDTRSQALDAYRGRGAFRDWPETMLADYVSEGFIEQDEGVVLACLPQWEASNYASQGHDPWRALSRLRRPVRILKAEQGSTTHLARGRGQVSVEVVPGGTHFFPMLKPEVARDTLFDAAV